ncbi:MAG: fimbrillin family protein [Prevotella sp.]|nr:fimbrillin family protein [Prevotella sp.]
MITKRRKFVTRFLPGLFTGLLLLSGCSQDDVSGVPAGLRVIGFRAQGGMSSLKATTTSADYIHSFAVNARYREGDGWEPGKFLLHGTTVYRGESGAGWDYSPKAYFPAGDAGSVEFFAYSPSGSLNVKNGGLGSDVTDAQKITYEVPAPVIDPEPSGVTAQEDFLVARQTVNGDEDPGYSGSVTLSFRHALSRILVSARSSLGEEMPVTITKLVLKNLYCKGELSLKDVPVDGWGYNGSTAGYNCLWDRDLYSAAGYLRDYPYLLPKSGVLVGTEAADVIGADQGMFILPQKTAGDNVKDDDRDGEFGLEVSYTVYGNPAGAPVFVQFSDLVPGSDASVTFETGRQYTLNLIFGAGGNDSDPFINIGAFVTFSPLNDEELDGPVAVPPPDPNHDPAAIKDWATSNIYFKPEVQGTGNGDGTGAGDVGSLTFAESKADGTIGGKEGYQGVYFKWGSLVGVSTNTTGTGYDDNNTFLFIPDLATGKYHKYKKGYVQGTPDDIVSAYLDKAIDNTWGSIPVVNNNLPDDRAVNALLPLHSPEYYQGDICRYLSDNRSVNGSGLVSEWRMPVSDMFAGDYSDTFPYKPDGDSGSVWNPNPSWSGFDGSDANGASQTEDAFMTYMYFPTGETVFFPASGNRDTLGWQRDVGIYGYYWSSSVSSDAAYARILGFGYNFMYPAYDAHRSFGYSVRCVRDGE